ncbi:hypothetical protein BKA61DRAFT_572966 [Leptodontidium sp. MPI-SDFR-AT-0119]|nr:hypothetical protein BKA61DRAFT_572966 [Leptodontidium sp. MPI-SDFR-AT-0119]
MSPRSRSPRCRQPAPHSQNSDKKQAFIAYGQCIQRPLRPHSVINYGHRNIITTISALSSPIPSFRVRLSCGQHLAVPTLHAVLRPDTPSDASLSLHLFSFLGSRHQDAKIITIISLPVNLRPSTSDQFSHGVFYDKSDSQAGPTFPRSVFGEREREPPSEVRHFETRNSAAALVEFIHQSGCAVVHELETVLPSQVHSKYQLKTSITHRTPIPNSHITSIIHCQNIGYPEQTADFTARTLHSHFKPCATLSRDRSEVSLIQRRFSFQDLSVLSMSQTLPHLPIQQFAGHPTITTPKSISTPRINKQNEKATYDIIPPDKIQYDTNPKGNLHIRPIHSSLNNPSNLRCTSSIKSAGNMHSYILRLKASPSPKNRTKTNPTTISLPAANTLTALA